MTSATEVVVPCISNFLNVGLNNYLCLSLLFRRQTGLHSQNYVGRQPKLGFAVRMGNMHMNALLFAGEEEQPKLPIPDDGRCHIATVAECTL